MQRQLLFRLSGFLALNILLSCTLLPFVIPPFEGYSLSDLLGVLLWQSIGTVGWPFALFGMVLSIPFGAKLTGLAPLMLLLIYPVNQFLLIRAIISKTPHRTEFILLHICLTFSFGVMWYAVLNGYDFMMG
jgi:hypothetical protein